MAPAIKNLVRLSVAGYSKNVLGRQKLYQLMVSKEKGPCEHFKRLQLAENKLFGGRVPGLTKALRDGDQVIIYLLSFDMLLIKLVMFSPPQLGTFGKRGRSFEVKSKTIRNNFTYQPCTFKGKSKFFQNSQGGKWVNKGRGRGFITK